MQRQKRLTHSSLLSLNFTYDFTNHEDEADGRGDVEFLLGQQLVHAVLTCQGFGTVAVGADRSFQLDGTSHTAVFKRKVGIFLLGVWKGAAGRQKVFVKTENECHPSLDSVSVLLVLHTNICYILHDAF